jgi:hypothetical protein
MDTVDVFGAWIGAIFQAGFAVAGMAGEAIATALGF